GAVAVLRQDDVEQRLHWVAMARRGDLADGLALEVAQRVLERPRDQDAVPAARFIVEALRLLGVDHLVAQLRARRGVAQPRQQRVPAAALGPGRNRRVERRGRAGGRVLIGGDVEPGRARGTQARGEPGLLAPAL